MSVARAAPYTGCQTLSIATDRENRSRMMHFIENRLRMRGVLGFLTGILAIIAGLGLGCGSKNQVVDPGDGGPSILITAPLAGASVSGIGFYITGSVAAADSVSIVRMSAGGIMLDSASSTLGAPSIPFAFYVPAALFDPTEELAIVIEGVDNSGESSSTTRSVDIREPSLRFIGFGGDTEREPAWSPGGDEIAYTSEGDLGNRDIYVIDELGITPGQITTNLNEDRSPTWSPDGQYIGFASNRSGNWDIWSVNRSTDVLSQITTNGSSDEGPAWSPRGDQIAFHSKRDANANIYTVGVLGGAVSGIPARLTAVTSSESLAVWVGKNGEQLAFESNQNISRDIWMVTPPDVTIANVNGANDPAFVETDPHWSRLGDFLVVAYNSNANFDIWVVHPPSGTKRPLATSPADDKEPVWSRQGDKIAFASNRNGTYDIWILE